MARLGEKRPLAEWVGGSPWETYTVEEVWNPSLLLLRVQYTKTSARIVLKNHPHQSKVTDGEGVLFFALRIGIHQWTNRVDGTVHTLPLFDYGAPTPTAIGRQHEKGQPKAQ